MHTLNEREAFEVMTRFLRAFYDRTSRHGDMATLLTDIQIEEDGMTHDPAAWEDWLGFVREVKEAKRE